jgi:hypothetical protein
MVLFDFCLMLHRVCTRGEDLWGEGSKFQRQQQTGGSTFGTRLSQQLLSCAERTTAHRR